MVLLREGAKRKVNKTTVDPQNLKIKYIEEDIGLIRIYFITISMQKISSVHKVSLKIQQILGPHKLKGNTYPKIIEEFIARSKKSI